MGLASKKRHVGSIKETATHLVNEVSPNLCVVPGHHGVLDVAIIWLSDYVRAFSAGSTEGTAVILFVECDSAAGICGIPIGQGNDDCSSVSKGSRERQRKWLTIVRCHLVRLK